MVDGIRAGWPSWIYPLWTLGADRNAHRLKFAERQHLSTVESEQWVT